MAKPKSHRWLWKICHWYVCSNCGLIRLHNKETEREARRPCRNADDED